MLVTTAKAQGKQLGKGQGQRVGTFSQACGFTWTESSECPAYGGLAEVDCCKRICGAPADMRDRPRRFYKVILYAALLGIVLPHDASQVVAFGAFHAIEVNQDWDGPVRAIPSNSFTHAPPLAVLHDARPETLLEIVEMSGFGIGGRNTKISISPILPHITQCRNVLLIPG